MARSVVSAPAPSVQVYIGRHLDLATALEMRYEELGVAEDLNEAISAQSTIASFEPEVLGDDLGRQSFALASLFGKRFALLADRSDLDSMIALAEAALTVTPEDDPLFIPILHDLAISLYETLRGRRGDGRGEPVRFAASRGVGSRWPDICGVGVGGSAGF